MQMLKVDKENALDAAEEAEILRKNSEEKAVKLEEEYQVGITYILACHKRLPQNLQKRLRVTQEEAKTAKDRLDSIKTDLSEAENNAQGAETDVTKCNKEIIDLEEALDEAQENLANTLEKLDQAEKEADETSRSRKVSLH